MAKALWTSVDEYIAAQPESVRDLLQLVRSTIRAALPEAEEVLSYGIPAYRMRGVTVLSFAGWKHHYSVYPANERVVAEFRSELARYEIGKGTIRFPLAEPVPAPLIARIAKFRLKDAAQST